MKFTNALGGCANCGALTSPCWRKGPEEAKHLCNACGSRYLVKGTLEGYKPGQKNRSTTKRTKSTKSKPYASKYEIKRTEYSSKRIRLFKEHTPHRSYADKAVQVDPSELQGMQPFSQLFTAAGGSGTYLDSSSSPKSHFERITEEGSDASPASPEVKGSSEDSSSPEPDVTNGGSDLVVRRRARKPFRPTSSTW